MRSGRPRGPGKAFKKMGAKPPTFLRASPGPRGRPDRKNAPQKIRPDFLQVPSLGEGFPDGKLTAGRRSGLGKDSSKLPPAVW